MTSKPRAPTCRASSCAERVGKPRPRVRVSEGAIDAAARASDGSTRLRLTAKPKSAREGLEDGPDGSLVVRVSAPPVDGQANARIVELLAGVLGVPKSDVTIARGEGARHKEVVVALPVEEVRARLLA